MVPNEVLVIGCGPHFRKVYSQILIQHNITISAIVDLEHSRKEIVSFIKQSGLPVQKLIFLDETYRNVTDYNKLSIALKGLSYIQSKHAIIATEPKVRHLYMRYCLEKKMHLFIDKPPFAFTGDNFDNMLKQYTVINELASKYKCRISVSCERRAHVGYRWLNHYLKNIIQSYHIPISSISIEYAGGIHNTHEEYVTRENHPFKYGYGVLLHSGYHYIDLLMQWLTLNEECFDEMASIHHLSTIKRTPNNTRETGEQDILIQGAAEAKSFSTLFSLNLLGTSVSKKQLSNASNPNSVGKMRQEIISIHLGFLMSVHIRSLPFNKLKEDKGNHFEITILSSPELKNEPPIRVINAKNLAGHLSITSFNKHARQTQLLNFLKGGNPSNLKSHQKTVEMLSQIYGTLKMNALKHHITRTS